MAVQSALLDEASRLARSSTHFERFVAIRDAAAVAHPDDLPALLTELHTLQCEAEQAAAPTLPDPRAPYFAHMRLFTKGRHRDVLLGYQTFISSVHGVNIIDWRNAPMAKVFFNYDEGDEYEEEVNDRLLEGVLELRRIISFDNGRLVAISGPSGTLRWETNGSWSREGSSSRQASPNRHPVEGALFGTGATRKAPNPVSALLDSEQFSALEHEEERPLLILGSAGCGKTTVALHRLATLLHRRPDFYEEEEMAVIVPETGLARLTTALLRDLRLVEVPVFTFDDWVVPNGRRVLKGLPRRINYDAPPSVIRFKRHPAMRFALEAYVQQLDQEIGERLDRCVLARGRIKAAYHKCKGPTLEDKLRQVRQSGPRLLELSQHDTFLREAEQAEEGLYRLNRDRLRLFGDSRLMQRVLDGSDGTLKAGMMADLLQRSTMQSEDRSERRYRHVDADRLSTVDGRSIDEDTPDDLAESMDVEDFPILLELLRLTTGATSSPRGQMNTYRHMVVDEAQDLTLLELRALGGALEPDASLTVAGDHAQQIDPTTEFTSWDAVMKAIRGRKAHSLNLETSYRCPRTIMDFALSILGPMAPKQKPRAVQHGAPVLRSAFQSDGHRAITLITALSDLMAREPKAKVAIIARSPEQASQLHEALSGNLKARLVVAGDFEFRPGLDITDVSLVKGLEFDYVVIPDASAASYPETLPARRLLHVAATRTIHQLWVMWVGRGSPLLSEGSDPDY